MSMWNEDYKTAGNGLGWVFAGQILNLFGFIPVLGAILEIVGLIMHLVGLYKAGKVHDGFKTAFTVAVFSIIAAAVSALWDPFSLVVAILGMVEFYYICISASELLQNKGDHALSEKGSKVWKRYRGSVIVYVICTLVAYIPVLGVLAAVVAVVAAIVLIVASIQYIVFVYNAQKSLLA